MRKHCRPSISKGQNLFSNTQDAKITIFTSNYNSLFKFLDSLIPTSFIIYVNVPEDL